MPLYPIEKAEEASEGDHYAEIQTVVKVCFTEEVDIEAIDQLERQINCQVAMLVSFMLGEAKQKYGTEPNMGVCDILTRALAPGEAIAEYYRELADEAEAIAEYADDNETEVDHVQVVTDAIAEIQRNRKDSQLATDNPEAKQSLYNCMLKAGDRVRFENRCGTVLPPKRHGQFIVLVQDDSGNERIVQPSKITTATRDDVYLPQERDGNWVTFYEPDSKTSESTATVHATTASTTTTAFEYPCGLQVGDCVDFGENRSNSLPRTALVAEWQGPGLPNENRVNIATINGPSLVHISHIRAAMRCGIELQKTNDGGIMSFSEPKPAGSDTQ